MRRTGRFGPRCGYAVGKETRISHRKMHADELETDVALVRRLLAGQFPQWAELPIEAVESAGTDNAMYRLGEDMAVRLPRKPGGDEQVEKEQRWLPILTPHLPLAIPVPLGKGMPAEGYPSKWSVVRWLGGENATNAQFADRRRAAAALAQFIAALQQIDPRDGPSPGQHNFFRGQPLAMRDVYVREAITKLDRVVDTGAATAAWEAALRAPEWDRPPVWIHGDLSSGNLLVEGGRLSGVIDFGGLGVGDPACDLMVAWGPFSGESRNVFRAALAVDDATWARGRGWALYQALLFIPYYRDTNPVGVEVALRALDEVLADHERGG
jgi:aminoglycoside phosphotransferase (APT) family kinase protein